MVCKFKKAIYGLNQSLRAWFEKSSRVVSKCGLQQCHSDHSIFICHCLIGYVILKMYVNDILWH